MNAYEIELSVEIKSFSITRLKLVRLATSQITVWFPTKSWNQKFLDYEIETWARHHLRRP